jgi:hypothetical protein
MKRLILLAASALLLNVIGCGSALDDHSGFGGEDRGLAQGFTPCGNFLAPFGQSVTCHPNQYCGNVTFSDCVVGCLSNYNCSHDQVCLKTDGGDIGSCQDPALRP